MPEIRQNMATKEWVIIATERAKRPEDFVSSDQELTEDRAEWSENCPFCPGNEEPAPAEIMRVPLEGDWLLRVVKNKYPALNQQGERVRSYDGVHRWMSGVGYHEVIIESRRHNSCPALEKPEEVARTFKAFQDRALAMSQDNRIEYIIPFKNHGKSAGSSLVHPHAQIVGLPMVPRYARGRTESAMQFFDDMGVCVYCHMLKDELTTGDRIVAENDHFAAFVLYAAFSPFHIWVLPKQHISSFLFASNYQLEALADILRTILRKFYYGLGDPAYNYVIRTAPTRDFGTDYSHWYVSIVARVTKTAGFELGSGMFINTALPEENAAFLRSIEA